MRVVADIIASEALRACGGFKYQEWVPLRMEQRELTLGVRLPGREDVARAEGILARAKGRPLRSAEEVYAHETMKMKDGPATVSIILQALRIGGLGIAATPCEVFDETGLTIKKQSPFPRTFTSRLFMSRSPSRKPSASSMRTPYRSASRLARRRAPP